MKKPETRPIASIRIWPAYLKAAKVAAAAADLSIGEWLENAIREKLPPKDRKVLKP